MDDLITKIREYLTIINNNIEEIDKTNKGLVDFCIGEVIDRTKLYLNREDIPTILDRILAGIINNGLKRCLKDIDLSKDDKTNVDQAITSISDNGQSISYSNEITRYFTSVTDEELFTGFNTLINRYRRVKLVYPKKNEE